MRNLLNLAFALLLLPIGTTAAAQTINFDPPVFLHSDLNGSVVMASDAAGQVIWHDRHEPFGQKALSGAPVDADTSYHGKARDAQTGLIYFGARYYNPLLGRFLSVDPVGVQSDNLHSFNRYAFANNNPYKYTDPDGNSPVLVFEGAQLGATGGFFVCGPACAVLGGIGGGLAAGYLGNKALTWMFSEEKKGGADRPSANPNSSPPDNAYDPNGPKAPGRPGEAEGFVPSKGGDAWVPNPNPGRGGASNGWQDANGDVWVPSGQGGRAHGGPHWNVQTPGGGYRNVKPPKP